MKIEIAIQSKPTLDISPYFRDSDVSCYYRSSVFDFLDQQELSQSARHPANDTTNTI